MLRHYSNLRFTIIIYINIGNLYEVLLVWQFEFLNIFLLCLAFSLLFLHNLWPHFHSPSPSLSSSLSLFVFFPLSLPLRTNTKGSPQDQKVLQDNQVLPSKDRLEAAQTASQTQTQSLRSRNPAASQRPQTSAQRRHAQRLRLQRILSRSGKDIASRRGQVVACKKR